MINTEEMRRAANTCESASEEMRRAAGQFEDAVWRLERLLGIGSGGNVEQLIEALNRHSFLLEGSPNVSSN